MIEADEQALEVVLAGLLDLAAVDVDVVDDQLLLRDQRRQVEAERGHVLGELVGVLLEAHQHAGFVVDAAAPLTRKLMPSRVLPEPGPPQTSVGRPAGKPPWVISSRPGMPVGALRRAGRAVMVSVMGPGC